MRSPPQSRASRSNNSSPGKRGAGSGTNKETATAKKRRLQLDTSPTRSRVHLVAVDVTTATSTVKRKSVDSATATSTLKRKTASTDGSAATSTVKRKPASVEVATATSTVKRKSVSADGSTATSTGKRKPTSATSTVKRKPVPVDVSTPTATVKRKPTAKKLLLGKKLPVGGAKQSKVEPVTKKPQVRKNSSILGQKAAKDLQGKMISKKVIVKTGKIIGIKKSNSGITTGKKTQSNKKETTEISLSDDTGSGKTLIIMATGPDDKSEQKKVHARKTDTKNIKVGKTYKKIKKVTVPAPVTRKKKIQEQQERSKPKSSKMVTNKLTLKRNTEQHGGSQKKIITRKKPAFANSTKEEVDPVSNTTIKDSISLVRCDKPEGKSVSFGEGASSSCAAAPEKSLVKGSNSKKAKDDVCAIKKSDKKKLVKKKPKNDGIENFTDKGNVSGEVTCKTKEIVRTLTKPGVSKGTTKRKPRIKSSDLPPKKNILKKTLLPKPSKIISTKIKKMLIPSSSKVVKKRRVKVIENKCEAEKVAENSSESPRATEIRSTDEESTTSDEMTLDRLLLRQYQNQPEVHPNRSELSSPESAHRSATERPGPQTKLVKFEYFQSSPVLSPATLSTSEDENLKTIKNKLKVKEEYSNSESENGSSPASFKTSSKKKNVIIKSKSKGSDPGYNKTKSDPKIVKKEIKEQEGTPVTNNTVTAKEIEEKPTPKKIVKVRNAVQLKKGRAEGAKQGGSGSDTEQRARRMKLFGFWSGPKRHRVASLNALAKVHCLYENESRAALMGFCRITNAPNTSTKKPKTVKPKANVTIDNPAESLACTRTLRSAPGLRGMGKHWDMHNASSTSSASSSSDENSNSDSGSGPHAQPPPSYRQKQRQKLLAATSSGVKKNKQHVKKVVRKRRRRSELMMDLKDMVVRKRMASLNASAILAASYSVEKRPGRCSKDDGTDVDSPSTNVTKKKHKKRLSKKVVENDDSDVEVEECDVESGRSVIEVRTTPGSGTNKQVAVIVNQDTDVTITGVYVNSTTRSTHHEGFCSIAGMQYRISSTSHTQTEATAVATETLLHTSTAAAEHPPAAHHPPEPPLAPPIKSYTPLGALSNMQPPGAPVVAGPPHHHHHHPHPHQSQAAPMRPVNPHPSISPLGRRHGCSSAFSAPPPPQSYGAPPHPHQTPPAPPPVQHSLHPPPSSQHEPSYMHGYFQPAGPLISAHHHSISSSITNSAKGPQGLTTLENSATPTPPLSAASHSGPILQEVSTTSTPSGATTREESSDNDVIITATSCSAGGELPPAPQPMLQQPPSQHPVTYRYPQTYPPSTPAAPQHLHHNYNYTYPHTQYYPSPPASATIQYPANPPAHHTHYHNQEVCYPTSNYPSYYHHKSYSTPPPGTYNRHYIAPPPQYYSPDLYAAPGATNSSQPSNQGNPQNQQMVVTASSGSTSNYQPPPPSLVESYHPPLVPIAEAYPRRPAYYTGYSGNPAPAGCYSHSPPSRNLAFIDAAYQSCPCPMQSCPKNVHTGPLTGDGKGPHMQDKESFHRRPLPPVALALPVEPPGVLGPPSPARGSAGMPPPPSPVAASARNPNNMMEEIGTYHLRTNEDSDVKVSKPQFIGSKQEPATTDYVGETQLIPSEDNSNVLLTSISHGIGDGAMVQNTKAKSKVDITSNHFPTITSLSSNQNVCGNKPKKRRSTTDSVNMHLLCNSKFLGRSNSGIIKEDSSKMEPGLQGKIGLLRDDAHVKQIDEVLQNCNEIPHIQQQREKTSHSVLAGKKSKSVIISNECGEGQATLMQDLAKSQKINESQENNFSLAESKSNNAHKYHPLSPNSSTLHNSKVNIRKRKMDDSKDLVENKEPVTVTMMTVPIYYKPKVRKLNAKTYPNRIKKTQKKDCDTEIVVNVMKESRVVGEGLYGVKQNADECKVPKTNKRPYVRRTGQKQEGNVKSNTIRKRPVLQKYDTISSSTDTPKTHVRVQRKKRVSINEKEAENQDKNCVSDKVCATPRTSAALSKSRPVVGSKKVPVKVTSKKTTTRAKVNTKPHRLGAKRSSLGHQECSLPKKLPKKMILPKWSNGWSWVGEPFQANVALTSDAPPMIRKCYLAMQHKQGDAISVKDCVLLRSGQKKLDPPYVARIAALWENPDDGEMMLTLMWYYRPEHSDRLSQPDIMDDEIFASKHKDHNSVACIDDKCFVLTFNEYCRHRKRMRCQEQGCPEFPLIVPQNESYPRECRLPGSDVTPDRIFFCRRVYDFRQRRILKNPC